MKRYGKLVRDKVPDIIRAKGDIPNTREMDKDEYRRELLYKLIEEAEEVRRAAGYDSKNDAIMLEQLADVHEVLETILREFNIPLDELKETQDAKRENDGALEKRIFLESVQ